MGSAMKPARTSNDAPHVSEKEATDRVIDVLLSDDSESKAFGRTANDWTDLLLEFIVDTRSFAHLAFAAILDRSKPSLLPLLRLSMEGLIGDHANNWLAEANPEEIEREGFSV